jgi:hypothetical protein
LISVFTVMAVVVLSQPTRTNKRTPTDTNGNPVDVKYGWNGAAYKSLGLSGAVFDALTVQQDASVTAAWESFNIVPGRAGFVFSNNGGSVLACSTAQMTRAIHIPAATSVYIPLESSVVYYKTETAPAVEVQYGSVSE